MRCVAVKCKKAMKSMRSVCSTHTVLSLLFLSLDQEEEDDEDDDDTEFVFTVSDDILFLCNSLVFYSFLSKGKSDLTVTVCCFYQSLKYDCIACFSPPQ